MNKQEKWDIKIARQCLDFTGHICENKDCKAVKCPDCKKRYDIFITKDLAKYLVNVASYERKEIERLRRMLFIYICKKCEDRFHIQKETKNG